MKKTTFLSNGNFYKGNIHCHTTRSDGKLTADEIVEAYRSQGYHFLAITEHNIFSDFTQYDREDFVMIPGVEEASVSASPADQARAEAEALSAAYRNAYSAAQLAVTAFPDGYEPRVLEFAVNGYETDPASGEVTCSLTMMMAAEEAGGV